jgi:RimJ/RimL family protein N-acetyltransferase
VSDSRGHRVELGYVIAQPHRGRGYATEAATRIVEWALDNPGVVRVRAYCHVDNAASARVLDKAGMVREGRLKTCRAGSRSRCGLLDLFASVAFPIRRATHDWTVIVSWRLGGS